MIDLASIPLVQARNFRRGRSAPIRLIVLHDMEAAETRATAENVARWFASVGAPMASAHYCVDCDSTVRCVHDEDTAFHAKGANHDGIGIELAGYARQTAAEWADAYSTEMLLRAAQLVAALAEEHDLPIAYVDEAGLLSGARGVTTHRLVSRAFKIAGGHTDPGPSFPMAAFLDRARAAAAERAYGA